MAEGFPSLVADRILELLGSGAMRELGSLRCVHQELSDLEEMVSKIRAVLVDEENRRSKKDQQVKDWVKRFEDVMYEADDLLDGFFTTAMRRRSLHGNELVRQVCNFFSAPLASALKLCCQVKKIKKRLENIATVAGFNLGSGHEESQLTEKEDEETGVGSWHVGSLLCTGGIDKIEDEKNGVIEIEDEESGVIEMDDEGSSHVESQHHTGVMEIEEERTSVGSSHVESQLLTGVIEIEEERTNIGSADSSRTMVSPPSDLDEGEYLPGRGEDKKKIIQILFGSHSEEGVQILSIVGMGGSGKTVIAQHVFNDGIVNKHFEIRIWVTVFEKFDLKEIVKQIIYSAADRIPENLDFEQLKTYGEEVLRGRKYFLVLDGVQEAILNSWQSLRSLLEVGANGSRVLVTTRSEEVAKILNSRQTYKLGAMDAEDSWILFRSRAFAKGDEFSPDLERIGREIVESCQGLPLAVVVVASSLRGKTTMEEWSFVLKKLQGQTQKGETQKGQTQEGRIPKDIAELLYISFLGLPLHLKHCLTYCGLFPEDCEIDVQALLSMWMSQGFVEPLGAEECMMDLLDRALITEVAGDNGNNMTKCTMHDLIRELAISAAGNGCATLRPKQDLDTKPLHVSFDFHIDSPWQVPQLVHAKRTRTIILPSQLRREIDGVSSKSICDAIVSRFKFLRTLDLHNSGIKVVPSTIGKLKHLRYLDLSQNTAIKRLPNTSCKLWNLQTLKLNHCWNLQELPKNIKKLVNLRSLEIDSCHSLTHMPCGLGQLTNLSTLSEFVLGKGTSFFSRKRGELGELEKLKNLRGQLKIKNLSPGKDASPTKVLMGKQHLRSLVLIWDIVAGADVDAVETADRYKTTLESLEPHPNLRELSLSTYGGVEFPRWLPSHKNLSKFSLWSCVKCQSLPPLNHLPHLKVMVLEDMTNLEYISDGIENASSTSFFPSLEELRITNLPKLKRWWNGVVNVEETMFPRLSKLVVEDCPNLTSMPLYPNLEELLVLKNISWEPLKSTISGRGLRRNLTTEASSSAAAASSTALTPLASLKTLCIVHMPDGYPSMWQSLQSLRSLTLDHLPYIEPLLVELQHAPKLEELHIWRCGDLMAVTGWISNLIPLKKLTIRLCPNLTIPLDEIGLLASIQEVEIADCLKIAPIENLLNSRFSRRNI